MTRFSAFLVALVFAVPLALAVDDFGPPVGSALPFELSLNDHTGQVQTMETLAGEEGLLIFYTRSLDWCPFCQAQMIEVVDNAERLRDLGWGIASISYDSEDKLARFAKRNGSEIALLSDPQSRTINALDIRNKKIQEGTFAYGVPHPIVFAVRPDGEIAAKFYEQGYQKRPPLDAIIEDLKTLKSGA